MLEETFFLDDDDKDEEQTPLSGRRTHHPRRQHREKRTPPPRIIIFCRRLVLCEDFSSRSLEFCASLKFRVFNPIHEASLSSLSFDPFFPQIVLPPLASRRCFCLRLCGSARARETTICDDEIFVFAFDASFIRDDDFFYDNLLCITRECRRSDWFFQRGDDSRRECGRRERE